LELLRKPGGVNEERAFLVLPVIFGTGIGLYFTLDFEPAVWAAPLALAVICMGLLALRERMRDDITVQRRHAILQYALLALVIAATGFILAQHRTWSVHTPVLQERVSGIELQGHIDSVERMRDGDTRIVLNRLQWEGGNTPPADQRPHRVRLNVKKGGDKLAPGQDIEIKAHLLAPSPPVIPGGFDFQRYIYFESIGAVGYARKTPTILNKAANDYAGDWLGQLRHTIAGHIQALNLEHSHLITALMTGQRGGIAETDWDAMRHSGLAHMLAISGLHVGLAAGVIFFFARLIMASSPAIALYWPIKKIAAGLAIAGAFFYMLIVGATVPTQRACLMTGLFMLAIILDRTPISLRLVAFAALVVLAIAPESLMSASFQMSFAAVTGLVLFYDATRGWWRRAYSSSGMAGKCCLYLLGLSATSVVATAATAPFAIYHFQHTALYGIIANLLAVPIMSFLVMPMAVLGYIFMSFNAALAPLWLMDRGVHAILQIAHGFAEMPGAYARVQALPGLALLALVAALFVFVICTGRRRGLALIPALIGLIAILQYSPPHILINENGRLVMLRDWRGQGNLLATSGGESYTRKQWLSRLGYGESSTALTIVGRDHTEHDLPCDRQGCRFQLDGHNVALSFKPYGKRADCRWADLLIARDPVKDRHCGATHIIDRFDVWADGAHSVRLDDKGISMTNVAQSRGQRPWTGTQRR
jgi:competence protein ComEC